MHSRGPFRLFTQYFLSYAIILFIPFLIGTILYLTAAGVLEESSRQSALAILEQTRDIFDSRIGELDSTARQISLSPKARSLLYMDPLNEGSVNYYGIWSFWHEMPNYSLANTFISSFYICARRTNMIVTPEEVMTNDEAHYNRYFRYRDWSLERWNEFLFGRYHTHDFLPGVTLLRDGARCGGAFYVQSIPMEYAKSPPGVFLVFIADSSLRDLMQRLDTGSRGLVLIADSSGSVVTSIAGKRCQIDVGQAARRAAHGSLRALAQSGYIVSQTRSSLNGWNYVSVLPASMVLAPVNRVRNIAIPVFVLGLLVALAVAASLARRSTRPIQRIVDRITGTQAATTAASTCRNELEYLDSAFTGLLEKDRRLRCEMERQIPVIRSDLTRRLLHGQYRNEDEARALAKAARIDLAARTFGTAVLRIEEYGEAVSSEVQNGLGIIKAVIRETLCPAEDHETFTHEQDDGGVAVLFLFPRLGEAEAAAIMQETLTDLADRLGKSYHVHVRFALGSTVSRFSELPLSHLQARLAIDAHLSPLPAAAGTCRQPETEPPFSYPMETELRLVAALKHADQAGVRSILAELRRENIDGTALSDRMFADFAVALRTSVIRCFGTDGKIAADLSSIPVADRVVWFLRTQQILCSFCGEVESARKCREREKADAIARRLQESYANPGLTIIMVAEEFGMSESSFYHFFRDAFGTSFSDYLEGLRIREACTRLASGASAIKDVAVAVGFLSDTTFRRAFHRVVGVSPSEYLRAVEHDAAAPGSRGVS